MWMIETGQKVKQVRGVLHYILQVLIPRLINQHLTITFSRSSCVQPVSRKLRVTFCQSLYSLRLLFCSCFNCRAPVGSLLCLNNILIGCHGIFISSNLSYVKFFFSFSLPMHMATQKLPPWLRMLQRPDFSQQVLMVQLRYNSVIDGFLFWCIKEKICIRKTLNPFFSTELIDVTKVRSRQYGGVVRVLDSKSLIGRGLIKCICINAEGTAWYVYDLVMIQWYLYTIHLFNQYVVLIFRSGISMAIVTIF